MERWRRTRAIPGIVTALIAVWPAAALASGPSPQSSPTTTQTPAPSPDPAPQATTPTHTPTHSSPAPTQTHASTPAPTHIAPATSVTRPKVVVVAPARVTTHAATTKPHRHRARPQSHPRHRGAPSRHVTHRAQPAPAPAAKIAVAHRTSAAPHDGLVLAVGAVVLLVLVATSLALLRRVTRLHREATTA